MVIIIISNVSYLRSRQIYDNPKQKEKNLILFVIKRNQNKILKIMIAQNLIVYAMPEVFQNETKILKK